MQADRLWHANQVKLAAIGNLPIDGMPNASESAVLAQVTKASAPNVHLFLPFDNAVIHRQRL